MIELYVSKTVSEKSKTISIGTIINEVVNVEES